MNPVSRNPFVKGAEVANFLVTNTEALSKVSSVAVAVLNFTGEVLSHFVPGSGATINLLSNLKKGPEAIKVFTSATGIVQRTYEFTDSVERSKISETWQKLAGRVTLTAAQALDTVSFLNSISVVDIGILGASLIGNLSIFSFVKNALVAVSSIFGIWNSARKIHEEKESTASSEVQRWAAISDADVVRHIVTTTKRDSNVIKYRQNTTIAELRQYKSEKYTKEVANSPKIIKKSWVGIAAETSKLAIIVLSSIALMFVVTSAAALLVVGATAVIAASIGLAKTFYDNENYGPKLDKIPVNRFQVA